VKNKELIKRVLIGIFISVIATAIYACRHIIYYWWLRIITPKTKDEANNQIIKELHPVFAYKIAKLVKTRENAGHNIILTSGFRSWEQQEELYNSGETTAPPGSSLHNYGMAVDLNEDGILKMATSASTWRNSGIVSDAENMGMRWGGDFNNYDPVHFDYMKKYDINLLKGLYQNGHLVQKKYVKIW
jgi:peptidoglycan L-alanyl-D-glutamate endopeptidase CwlK